MRFFLAPSPMQQPQSLQSLGRLFGVVALLTVVLRPMPRLPRVMIATLSNPSASHKGFRLITCLLPCDVDACGARYGAHVSSAAHTSICHSSLKASLIFRATQ